MNLAEALGERVGPLPAWLWALGIGGGLYAFAHWKSSQPAPTPRFGGPLTTLGSVAAPVGSVLELNPMVSNGINTQPGAALASPMGGNIPSVVPAVSGGDNPFVGGYTGISRATPYDYARGGPS